MRVVFFIVCIDHCFRSLFEPILIDYKTLEQNYFVFELTCHRAHMQACTDTRTLRLCVRFKYASFCRRSSSKGPLITYGGGVNIFSPRLLPRLFSCILISARSCAIFCVHFPLKIKLPCSASVFNVEQKTFEKAL